MITTESEDETGGIVGSLLVAKATAHFRVAFEHGVACWTREDLIEFTTDMSDGKSTAQEFCNDFTVGNEIN